MINPIFVNPTTDPTTAPAMAPPLIAVMFIGGIVGDEVAATIGILVEWLDVWRRLAVESVLVLDVRSEDEVVIAL